jgi:hypothetical protein
MMVMPVAMSALSSGTPRQRRRRHTDGHRQHAAVGMIAGDVAGGIVLDSIIASFRPDVRSGPLSLRMDVGSATLGPA